MQAPARAESRGGGGGSFAPRNRVQPPSSLPGGLLTHSGSDRFRQSKLFKAAVAGSILRLMKEHDSLSLESLKFLHKSTHQVDSKVSIEKNMVSLMAATPKMGRAGSLHAPFGLGAIGGVGTDRRGAVYYIDRVSSQEHVGGISEEDLTRCVLDFEALFLLMLCSEVYQPVVQVQS